MIRYALACEKGHAFESWFRSSDDFDQQSERHLVGCPVCGSLSVTKQIMAPQIARSDPEQPASPVALIDDRAEAVRRMIGEIHQYLATHSNDVGDKFADEARKIHYGESDARPIHGVASGDEARALAEEGIGILPVPVLPEERN